MTTSSRFWTTWGVLTALGLTYPLAVWLQLREEMEDALRWIQNDPAFNVFVPLIMPLAAAVFAAAIDLKPFRDLSSGRRLASLLVGLGLAAITFMAVLDTVHHDLLEPFLFEESEQALAQERSIRGEVRSLRKDGASQDRVETVRSEGVSDYQQRFPGFGSVAALKERGSVSAWLALALNGLAGAVVVTVFWYLWNLVVFRRQFDHPSHEWIPLVVGLLVLWFPIRLYSEWYIGFYSLARMKDYPVFVFLFVVAIAGYAFCVFRLARSFGVKVFSVVGTGLLGLFGIGAKVQPEWLGWMAVQIERMPFKWFAASMAIVVVTLSAMVLSLVEPSGEPRTRSTGRSRPGRTASRKRTVSKKK
jgi:hypothetical protein